MTDIGDEERMRRKQAIDQARASVRLSGTILPPEIERLNQRYIAGELSSAEHVQMGLALADALGSSRRS